MKELTLFSKTITFLPLSPVITTVAKTISNFLTHAILVTQFVGLDEDFLKGLSNHIAME